MDSIPHAQLLPRSLAWNTRKGKEQRAKREELRAEGYAVHSFLETRYAPATLLFDFSFALSFVLCSLPFALGALPFALFLCYAPLRSKYCRPMTVESKSRVLHENLDTSFVNLWSLLRSLSQRGFIGRVHVELTDYTADVYMTGSNAPLVHEIDRAAGTETLEQAALHRLVLRARESSGSISVFEGADEAVVVRSAAVPEAIVEPAASVPTEEPPPDTFSEAPPEIADQPAKSEPALADSDEESELAVTATSLAEPAVEHDDSEGTIDWSEVVKASGELIGGVERALTGTGADFAALFRATRLELADDYTFLDPLSSGFEYANSQATVTHELPPHTYVAGLSEALRRVVEKVATGDRARRVRERVALELALLARKRKELLTRSGFQAQFDRIAGTKVI